MKLDIDFRIVELMSARLCHELISPVGAINNGVELLGEDDPDFVKEAIALVGQSARRAGQRLQFYRFAYGASGGGTSSGPTADCRSLALGLLEGGKVRCEWDAAVSSLSTEWQKLACNLVVVADSVLPRGGTVTVRSLGDDGIEVAAEGGSINFSDEYKAALDVACDLDALTSRTIHPHFTALLARYIDARLDVVADAARLVLAARRGA